MIHGKVLDVWMPQTLPDIRKGAPQTWCTALMHDIHQSVMRTQANLCLRIHNPSVTIIHYKINA